MLAALSIAIGASTLTASAANRPKLYVLQFGSYPDFQKADKSYNKIIELLHDEDLELLRIEKVGKYYALRLGRFDLIEEAKAVSAQIKSRVWPFIIVKTRFIEKRIVKIYGKTAESVAALKPAPAPEPIESAKVPELKKPDAVPEPIKTARVQEPIMPALAPEPKKPALKTMPDSADKEIKPSLLPPGGRTDEATLQNIFSLVENKEYKTALNTVKGELKKSPLNPELNAWKGMILLKMDQPSKALPYLKKAVRFSPEEPDYRSSLGYCFFFMDQHDEAESSFHEAIKHDPEHIDALSGIGMIYGIKGEKEKALDIYEKLKSLDQDSAEKLLQVIQG